MSERLRDWRARLGSTKVETHKDVLLACSFAPLSAEMGEVAIYCVWDGRGVDATDPAIAKDPTVLTEILNEGSDPEKGEEPVGPPLHWETPLTCSSKLSRKLGAKVWLKLDNLQPPQSYKIRGIGLLCQRVSEGGEARDL